MAPHWQYVVVTVVVAASAVQLFRKLAPQASARMLSRTSEWLDREGRTRSIRALGVWLRPASLSARACDTGCSTCQRCGDGNGDAGAAEKPDAQTLEFRPFRR
jgi:hypothetical protein